MSNTSDNDPFHQHEALTKKRKRRKKNQKAADESEGFMNKKVNLVDSILFPDGYENLMLGIYFLIIPYINGLLFIFFHIAKGDSTVFLSLNSENAFIITWLIGYEVTAGLLLLWITKLGITSFFQSSGNKNTKAFRIP